MSDRKNPSTVFTPAHPATGLTFSRREENSDLSNYLGEPGSQVLIYGQTGIGKTSLVLNSLIDAHKWIRYQCTSETTFEKIISYFTDMLLDPQPTQVERYGSSGTSLLLGVASSKAQFESTGGFREVYNKREGFNSEAFIFALAPECWKLVIDDFERITSEDTKIRIAQLAKSFSDQAPLVQQDLNSSSAAKIIIIGIAETMSELLAGDASNLGRVMSIHLQPLSDQQVRDFLTNGFDYLDIKCHPEVMESFVQLAAGYPRYAHALALEACREAQNDDVRFISHEIGARAVNKTIKRYEPVFGDMFASASRSRGGSRKVHAKLLKAIANIRKIECDVDDILIAIQRIDPTLTLRSITPVLGELASSSRGMVLRRPRGQRGIYTFSDALFKSFVRMKYFEIQVADSHG